MMFALFFMIAFVTGLPSPMGVIVAKQFGASNFESQLGFLGNFLAYAFMGIPAGIMLKKYGYKKTALAAIDADPTRAQLPKNIQQNNGGKPKP